MDTDEVEQDKKSQRIEMDILCQLKGWTKKEATFLGQTDKRGCRKSEELEEQRQIVERSRRVVKRGWTKPSKATSPYVMLLLHLVLLPADHQLGGCGRHHLPVLHVGPCLGHRAVVGLAFLCQ